MDETRDDRWGNPHTTPSEEAVDRLDRAVLGLAGHRSDTPQLLRSVFDADRDLVAAHVLRGFALSFLGRNDLWPEAETEAARARRSLRRRGGTHRETLLTQALDAWLRRDLLQTEHAFDDILAASPRDLLTIKLSHAAHFFVGQPAAMRLCLERVLPAWDTTVPGYGFVLGCHAFALEETGALAEAERAGRTAVHEEPRDVWGAHAVAHVYEMTDRPEQGLEWLALSEDSWVDCNNFAGHLQWHRALFLVELGRFDEAFECWESIARHLGEDFRDASNAASLLWRLEECGMRAGPQWEQLAQAVEPRSHDHGSAFADVHYIIALARARGVETATERLDSMRKHARTAGHAHAHVADEIGVPLAEGVIALANGDARAALSLFDQVTDRTQALGGSHAQRDTFQLMRLAAAAGIGDPSIARKVIDERLRSRPNNRWAKRVASALDAGFGARRLDV